MMRALLLMVFMFSLSCWAAPSAKEEPARSPTGQDNKAGTNTNQQQAAPAPVITKKSNLAETGETKPNSKEHGESAASAEERVALWTERLTYATAALVVATLLLWIAALATFFISKKTAERQLRAYVNVAEVGSCESEAFEKYEIRIVLHNFGHTPAYNCKLVTHIGIGEEKTEPESVTINRSTVGVIAPGDKYAMVIQDIPAFDTRLIAGTKIHVYGRFEYGDAFEAHHFTDLWFHTPPPFHKGKWSISTSGNDCD